MTSKLSQMQARFQQRQMAEKEEKLLKLYENQQQRAFDKVGRGSAGSNGSLTNISTGNGKVRQMFDERRQKAGIDRSYPLEPLSKTMPVPSRTKASLDRRVGNTGSTTRIIRNTTKSTSNINGNKMGNTVSMNSTMRKTISTTGSLYNNNSKSFDEADAYLHEHDDLVRIMNKHNINDLEDEEMPNMPNTGFEDLGYDEDIFTGKLANVGGKLPSEIIKTPPAPAPSVVKRKTVGKLPARKPTVAQQQQQRALAPPTRPAHQQQPPSAAPAARASHAQLATPTSPTRTNNTRSESSSSGNSSKESTPSASPAKTMSRQIRQPQSGDAMRAPSSIRSSTRPPARPSSGVQRDDLTPCRFCMRRFQTDRIQKHEDICGRTAKKKRKTYDSTKHRLAGTEVEPYAKKAIKSIKQTAAPEKAATKQPSNKTKPTTSKTSWRQKHEEFIATIRAAKQAQAHIASGGNIRDLPPPPPSSNPDYVQCPHCGRRFNESAASRHIPKCANYMFNKPKPARK